MHVVYARMCEAMCVEAGGEQRGSFLSLSAVFLSNQALPVNLELGWQPASRSDSPVLVP